MSYQDWQWQVAGRWPQLRGACMSIEHSRCGACEVCGYDHEDEPLCSTCDDHDYIPAPEDAMVAGLLGVLHARRRAFVVTYSIDGNEHCIMDENFSHPSYGATLAEALAKAALALPQEQEARDA